MISIAALALSSFAHIVVIVQENRTPDNLFYALCATQPCSTTDPAQYDILTSGWLDATATGGKRNPHKVPLGIPYDLTHAHSAFVTDYANGAMNGFGNNGCFTGLCPSHASYGYVDNSTGVLNPYLTLVEQYGWSNFFFQTNQGPSFPSHQDLFGATSAPTAQDDALGNFAAENPIVMGLGGSGCNAFPGSNVQIIDANGNEAKGNTRFPCFTHATLADLLEPLGISWKYYAVGQNSIWVAPAAISTICNVQHYSCGGQEWVAHNDPMPPDVLADATNCKLPGLVEVTPSGINSDHAGTKTATGGPSWVASIVNAIGQSRCVDPNGLTYWQDTAIIITWDDWGGWYDHEPPAILQYPQGGYQLGFRVPFIFVSAYTPAGYIDNTRADFGSIIRFIEGNFGIQEGALGFADSRSAYDLSNFYHLQMRARTFTPIIGAHSAKHFMRQPQGAPDTD